jgi:hypothetical protein
MPFRREGHHRRRRQVLPEQFDHLRHGTAGIRETGKHLTDYRPPRLELSLVHDAIGQPFVLLAGFEPDFATPPAKATGPPGTVRSSATRHRRHP